MELAVWVVLSLPWTVPSTPSIHAVAVAAELADADESYLSLTSLCLRWRMLRDTPRTWEVIRFPDEDTARAGFMLARGGEEFARANREYEAARWATWTQVVEMACERRHAWECLYDARTARFGVVTRRRALARLRDAIGEGAWDRGVMPTPTVPLRWE